MNIKRILILVMAAMLCLSASAMAKVVDLSTLTPNSSGWVCLRTAGADETWGDLIEDGDVITGSLNGMLMLTVEDDVKLTFKDVAINYDADNDNGALYIHYINNPDQQLTINFEGKNFFNGMGNGNSGIRHYGVDLILQGNGYWRATGDNADISNPVGADLSFTLPAYQETAPAGKAFKEWVVSEIGITGTAASVKQPGETVITTAWQIYIEPVFEDAPVVITPATGDGANLALWCGLAAISFIGMAMMLRKKKEA